MSKYKNPIAKPETVTIPVWHYEAMVNATTTLGIVCKLVNNLESYELKRVLDMLLGDVEGGIE